MFLSGHISNFLFHIDSKLHSYLHGYVHLTLSTPSRSHKSSLLSPPPFLFPLTLPSPGLFAFYPVNTEIDFIRKVTFLFSTREIYSQNFFGLFYTLPQSEYFNWIPLIQESVFSLQNQTTTRIITKTRVSFWTPMQSKIFIFCKFLLQYFALSRKFLFVWGEKGDCQTACHQISCSPLAIFSHS